MRTKIYLSSEKSCKVMGKFLVDENYCVHIGKEKEVGKSKVVFFVEYWRE